MNARPPANEIERRQLELSLAPHHTVEWRTGLLNPIGLWHRRHLVAATMWQREPGGSAVLWHPSLFSEYGESIASTMAALFLVAAQDAGSHGCRYAIAYADCDEALPNEALSLTQFPRLTTSLALSRMTTSGEFDTLGVAGTIVDKLKAAPGQFHRVFEQVQGGSQDCVGLRGLRTVEQTFAMFAAAGTSQPSDWLLVEHESRQVAILLLNKSWDARSLEICYLGVVPGLRRHGIGQALVKMALRQARAQKFSRLNTVVDIANVPARRLYKAMGFAERSRHHVFIKRFSG